MMRPSVFSAAVRAFGVRVSEFMIGLPGPHIGVQRGETKFGVTAIPLGGYARVCGMEPGEMSPYLEAAMASVYARGTAVMEDVAADCGCTDDEAYEGFRGVRKITCIPSFKHEFLSYMLTDNTNSCYKYDEESARADTETTVRLQDGICFVARYWDANYLERLEQVLRESFEYTTPLEKLNG